MTRAISRFLALLFLLSVTSAALTDAPSLCKVEGIQRIKQLTNYCGPACIASVLTHYGKETTQDAVGRVVYNPIGGSTHGADMLLYARDQGFAAYSWNSGLKDVKGFLAAGVPVIALQQNSLTDTSGHYRILTGFDDARQVFHVVDPYYDTTEISYAETERLWAKWGYWALLICPKDKDTYQETLDKQNAVLHMDLCYGELKRRNYERALAEANIALALAPGNRYTLNLVDQINRANGAGKR